MTLQTRHFLKGWFLWVELKYKKNGLPYGGTLVGGSEVEVEEEVEVEVGGIPK